MSIAQKSEKASLLTGKALDYLEVSEQPMEPSMSKISDQTLACEEENTFAGVADQDQRVELVPLARLTGKHQIQEPKMTEELIAYSAQPALKHGAYSAMSLLPGEDPAAFRKLCADLIAEYKPAGPSELAIVLRLARVIWREQHLAIYGYAARARQRYSEIRTELAPRLQLSQVNIAIGTELDPEVVRKAEKAAEKKATEELGSAWGLIEMGEVLTFEHLHKELEVAERLSRRKERLLKQLMFARGVKSLSLSALTSATPPLITTGA